MLWRHFTLLCFKGGIPPPSQLRPSTPCPFSFLDTLIFSFALATFQGKSQCDLHRLFTQPSVTHDKRDATALGHLCGTKANAAFSVFFSFLLCWPKASSCFFRAPLAGGTTGTGAARGKTALSGSSATSWLEKISSAP